MPSTSKTARHRTAEHIGGQSGRVAVVTGSNTGVGFEVAKQLAAHGAWSDSTSAPCTR